MRLSRKGEIQDRFWLRVEKGGENECWNWTGTVNDADGYGKISGRLYGARLVPAGRSMLAHRVSWMLNYGPIPEGSGYHGAVIRHSCDNPRCVNPRHLLVGTQQENVNDMNDRGRGDVSKIIDRTGHSHHRAVLDVEKVAYVLSSTKTNGELAEELGVHKATIKRCRCGRTGYVDAVQKAALQQAAKGRKGLSRPGMENPCAKLDSEKITYIRSSPLTTYQLAEELGLHQTTIARARRGATYAA